MVQYWTQNNLRMDILGVARCVLQAGNRKGLGGTRGALWVIPLSEKCPLNRTMATPCGSESSIHHARNLFLTSSSGPPAGADITVTDKLLWKKTRSLSISCCRKQGWNWVRNWEEKGRLVKSYELGDQRRVKPVALAASWGREEKRVHLSIKIFCHQWKNI